MVTSLGYVDDPASWSQVSTVAGTGPGHDVLIVNANSDTGNIYCVHPAMPLPIAGGVVRFSLSTQNGPNGTAYFGLWNSANVITGAGQLAGAAGFCGVRWNPNSPFTILSIDGTVVATVATVSLIASVGTPEDYYLAWWCAGGVMTMRVYKGGLLDSNLVFTGSGAAPAYTTVRPVVGGANGGSFALFVHAFGAPWYDSDVTAYGTGVGSFAGSLTAVGFDSSADLQWTSHPFADSYDWRVNGGSATNVPDAPTLVGRVDTGVDSRVRITGLTNGTTYTVEVRPVFNGTPGAWTSTTVTPVACAYYDDFVRTNSTTVPGSPLIGSAITPNTGSWGISGNALYTSTSTSGATASVAGVPADVDISFQIGALTSASGNSMGIAFREAAAEVTAANAFLLYFVNGTLNFQRRVAASGTTLFSWTVAANDVVRLVAKGADIYLWVNGLLRYQCVDSMYQTNTGCVLWSSTNTVGRFDWLKIAPAPAVVVADGTAEALDTADVASPFAPVSTAWAYRGRDTYSEDLAGVA